MGRLTALGYTCRHDPSDCQAPVAIINTCGFIGDAKEESIQTILTFAERKAKGSLRQLYVMGCLSERYRTELPNEIPEVDGWYGKFDYDGIVRAIARNRLCPDNAPRVLTTPAHYAYLKISEGCNRFCSYCAIPLITGRYQSVPMDRLLKEVQWMAAQGVKEVNVIAQDLTSYGMDLYHEHKLAQLIDRMADIEGIRWIRLHYAYPTDFQNDVLEVMAKRDNVCKYLDIALQHCSNHILSLMRRHITREQQDALIAHIRDKVPNICLRTTLMVGHPGETEDDFQELLTWTKQMRFDRMGAFAYSDEEGTYAHTHYQDNIPAEVKQQRLDELMALQQEISAQQMQKKIGQVLPVIIDRKEGDYLIGRTEQDSPDVDCEVLVKGTANIGDIISVKITKAEEFDLYGLQLSSD